MASHQRNVIKYVSVSIEKKQDYIAKKQSNMVSKNKECLIENYLKKNRDFFVVFVVRAYLAVT